MPHPLKVLLPLYERGKRSLEARNDALGSRLLRSTQPLRARTKAFLRTHWSATVGDHRMFTDRHDTLALVENGVHEPAETEIVRQHVREGDVVVDLGAHIGYYTLLFAKMVGPRGTVYAFEPEPSNFALLERNIAVNGYRNVVPVQKAVSNCSGAVKLYLCDYNMGMHRIYESRFCANPIDVETVRLDDYLGGRRVDFIKMDIEGSEIAAMRGMLSVLRSSGRVRILSEFVPLAIREFGAEPKDYLELLRENGFTLFEINQEQRRLAETSVEELIGKYDRHDDTTTPATNLLCAKDA